MPSMNLYPLSDVSVSWTPSSAVDHYTLIDDLVADDGDYIVAASDGKVDRFTFGSVTPGFNIITDITANIRIKGSASPQIPAINVRLFLNGAKIAEYSASSDTSGAWLNSYIPFTGFSIPASVWNNGVKEIEIRSVNGSASGGGSKYPDPFDQDV